MRQRTSRHSRHSLVTLDRLAALSFSGFRHGSRVQRYCQQRVPEHVLHQVRVECQVDARALTIVERRAPWRPDRGPEWTSFPIARLRWTAATRTWQLYWRDRNLKFHRYDRLPSSSTITDLLDEIDRDPTGIFWG